MSDADLSLPPVMVHDLLFLDAVHIMLYGSANARSGRK